jgi:hypothetical protein
MRVAMLVCVVACSGEADRAPIAPPPPPRPEPAPPPPAATAFAQRFAPEVVGTVVPAEPRAGDYAMELSMSFVAFVTTELRLDAHRTGALKLTLAADGTARACAGVRDHGGSQGQMNYEPRPERRRHSSTDVTRLLGLAGTWRVERGIATIRFDRSTSAGCDATGAIVMETAIEVRCIGVAVSERVPIGGLVCETAGHRELLELGMPMTTEGRRVVDPRAHRAPHGTSLVLAAPGVHVDVKQDRSDLPTVTFSPGSVTLTETDYQPRPPGTRPAP